MKTEATTHSTGLRRRSAAPMALALFILALVAVLLPAAALGRTTRPYQSSFYPFSAPPGEISGSPNALAVDQASGDVFVGSLRFTAAGAPHNFTAGPGAGTNILAASSRPVAIDNSGGALSGAIYIGEPENGTVKVFANDGASLGVLSGIGTLAGHFNHGICGVAVDQSNGVVYISERLGVDGGHIWRYASSSPSGAIDDSDYTLTGISADHPCDLAADSGNVYALDHVSSSIPPGPPAVDRYAASSFTTDFANEPNYTTVDTGELKAGPTAVAVDPKTGDVYVNEGHKVAVFDSTGTPLYTFGAAAYFGNNSEAIAVKSAASGPASAVYVADPQEGAHEVDVFGATAKAPTFTHPEVASFGPDGTSGSSFASNSLSRLAFDQAARRLYALDKYAPGLYGFDASAPPAYPPASGFSPLALPSSGYRWGFAVDNTVLGSAGNLYLSSDETNLLYGWDSAGAPLGGAFPVDPATSPGPPNGSPKELCGTAVDSAGNIWVANRSTKRILKYSPTGASLPGAIDTSAQGTPCQLAFDSDDDLYVTMSGSEILSKGIWRYTAASGYTSATRIVAAPGTEGNEVRLAVDPSTDHLYVAVDGSCNSPCNITGWVDEYDPTGKLVDEFAADLGVVTGVAVDATSHDIYVADTGGRKIRAFGPGILLPEVTARQATATTNTTATLNGLVNLQGVALDDCHFEYVTEAAFRDSGFDELGSGGSVPCNPAAGSIPLDLEDHEVSANVTGLSENTAYHYRLSTTNADGAVNDEEAFSSTGRPLVETTGAPVRSATTVRLEGRVNAHGDATTYHFEYGTEGPCDANSCESTEPHSAGSGSEIQMVAQRVEGLEPNTTYHYRLIAENGNPAGLGLGADMTVTTRASDAPLSHGHLPGPPGSDRAYEQVTLPDTSGNPSLNAFAISDDGNRAFYSVNGGTPISTTGTYFTPLYAERTASGWRSENIFPPRDAVGGAGWLVPVGRPDLSDQIVANYSTSLGVQSIWRLRPGQSATKVFQFAPGAEGNQVLISEDASRVFAAMKGSPDPAHPAPNNEPNLYEISSGAPRLVGLLPDGSVPACGAGLSGGTMANRASHWISGDSLLFFQSCNNLYVRDLDAEETKPIAPGDFIKSLPGAAFLKTSQSLDPDDTGGSDVYRYDVAAGALECVTCVVAGDANVIHAAIASDGSRVYFTSSSVLLPGAAAPGVYRLEGVGGDLAYVAPDSVNSIGEDSRFGQAITPNGATLLFASDDSRLNALGGQQNGGTLQYYRYDDRDRSLTCLSCPQDGGTPVDGVEETLGGGSEAGGANNTRLSADGATVAFTTDTPLARADQNTARAGQNLSVGADVYEWRDGRLLLVSDGLTNWPVFGGPQPTGMSPSGKDILFAAYAQYTQDALDAYRRVYDARIGGGFEFPPPPKPCPLEVCQGTPKGTPEEQAPGTGAFAGPGNTKQPPSRHKKRKNHKKSQDKRKAQHKKQSRAKAKHDRRAQR